MINTKEKQRTTEITEGPSLYVLERLAGLKKTTACAHKYMLSALQGNSLPKSVYFILSDGSSLRVDEIEYFTNKAGESSFTAVNINEGIKTYAKISRYCPSLGTGICHFCE